MREEKTLIDRLNTSIDTKTFELGFDILDSLIGGVQTANTYCVGGAEKSGKSDFLLQIAHNLLSNGTKIAYFNTELGDQEYFARLTARWLKITKKDAEADKELLQNWASKYQDNLLYYGITDLTDSKTNLRDFNKTLMLASEAVQKGAKILFFDNLTTFSVQATNQKKGWEILAQAISQIINFSKAKNVCSFVVLHTRPQTVFTETPTGIKKIIEERNPERIFEESVTIIRRPNISDLYGGGSALSQLSGSILIWRPFAKYANQDWTKITQVCIDSFRSAPSGSAVTMDFDGATGQFTEDMVAETLRQMK